MHSGLFLAEMLEIVYSKKLLNYDLKNFFGVKSKGIVYSKVRMLKGGRKGAKVVAILLGSTTALILGLAAGLEDGFTFEAVLASGVGLVLGSLTGLLIGWILGAALSLIHRKVPKDQAHPNQGMRLTLINASLWSLVLTAFIVCLIAVLNFDVAIYVA